MQDHSFILADCSVVPEIFLRVLEAKRLLSTGEAKNASDAAQRAGISRSAFYKYKDAVYSYNQFSPERIITLFATLKDNPGVLSKVINELYKAGANILTVNQNIPIGNVALVSVSARVDSLKMSLDELLKLIKEIDGVETIGQVSGD